MSRRHGDGSWGSLLDAASLVLLLCVTSTAVGASSFGKSNSSCGQKTLTSSEGIVSSPNYPEPYPSRASCTWKIRTTPGTVLNININDLDIEGDASCRQASCCPRNWLSVSVDDGAGAGAGRNHKFCGRRPGPLTLALRQRLTVVKFLASSALNRGHKGFTLSYFISRERRGGGDPPPQEEEVRNYSSSVCEDLGQLPCVAGEEGVALGGRATLCYQRSQRCDGVEDCPGGGVDEAGCPVCGPDQLPCADGLHCYQLHQLCDKVPHCADYTDEITCPGECGDGDGLARCGVFSANCFRPKTDLCNGRFDCPDGEDELGCDPLCPRQLNCSSGRRCYPAERRCDGVRDCPDGSDELCPPGGFPERFRCDNRLWVPQYLCCNGVDNCGDNSDERNCIKTSVITAAIMGSLLCGLLLVVAVGCMCRLYSLRVANASSCYHHDYDGPPGRPPPAAAAPDEFFVPREPPPAYNVAVSCPLQRLPPAAVVPPPGVGGGRPRRPSRRPHPSSSGRRGTHRAHATAVVVPPPGCVDAAPPPPPPGMVVKQQHQEDEGRVPPPPPSSSSSSSESPSRDSVASSASLVSFLSGDDDVPLLC